VTFPLRTKRSAFASVPGIAAIIALLLVLSYAQSQLAPLRRRRRWSSLFGLAFAGAILGGLAAVFAWLTSSDELLTSTLTATAAAGAVAGVLLGATTYKAGRRSRLLHIVRKSQLVEELPTTANV
jgi:predicted membrane protein